MLWSETIAVGPSPEANITSVLAALLDRFLYRHPFEGASARRYIRSERPAFGDLDDRLLDGLADELSRAETLLDLGCGPGTFTAAARARHPALTVIPVDPSRDFAATTPGAIRARGEALPLADSSIDVAVCLSSIRHVRDRLQTLRELRRVVRGRLVIVELDPDADRARIATHADHLGSRWLRRAFAPLVLRTAPHARAISRLARDAGFVQHSLRADPVQPVYILELR
jgi:ubiquinone/menaquinone biosynthesis C-methylase UbiE